MACFSVVLLGQRSQQLDLIAHRFLALYTGRTHYVAFDVVEVWIALDINQQLHDLISSNALR